MAGDGWARFRGLRVSQPLGVYLEANQEWALDFVHEVVQAGRTIRVLCVIDAYTRKCLALEVETSFAGLRVTPALDEIIARRGSPQSIRCDSGPELTSSHFLAASLERKIQLVPIQPGKPTQNGYVESFNGKLREECLRISWFQNLFEARRMIAAWCREYNQLRPHSSLSYLTPAEFAAQSGRGKDADKVRLENDTVVFHFPAAATATG